MISTPARMFRIERIGALVAALFIAGQTANAVTVVKLNTGYNNSQTSPGVYPLPGPPTSDHYWINTASFFPPPTTAPMGPAFVLNPPSGTWQPALPDSRWISARSTMSGAPGTDSQHISYTIFRKCFCLERGFNQAKISFKVRADDDIRVYLNGALNELLPISPGNWGSSTALSVSGWTKGFKVGRNCLFVYLEDNRPPGWMGFNLSGDVSANGLFQHVEKWGASPAGPSFAPGCCPLPHIGQATVIGAPPATLREAREVLDADSPLDDEAVMKAIVEFAEKRRGIAAAGRPAEPGGDARPRRR